MASADTFVAIDFETANPARNSACQVGLVRVESGKIVDEHRLLIRPPTSWFMFTNVHGIAWDDVANEPTFKEHWATIRPMLRGADYLVAHNAPFDRSVLKACCGEYGLTVPATDFLCTLKLARQLWTDLDDHKLPTVCKKLKVKLSAHHDALADARACAGLVLKAQAALGRNWAPKEFC